MSKTYINETSDVKVYKVKPEIDKGQDSYISYEIENSIRSDKKRENDEVLCISSSPKPKVVE
jgi:hypothetical protein